MQTDVCYRMKVSGKVQGVFYRASTRDKARQLGLTGWVKNEQDGSVILEAQGDQATVEALVRWCKEGPPQAVVRQVMVEEMALGTFAGFEVRY